MKRRVMMQNDPYLETVISKRLERIIELLEAILAELKRR